MRSGIFEILLTISLTVSAFFIGSFLESSNNMEALNWIKSLALSFKYKPNSSNVFCFAKLSGSSPSGKVHTLTFIPCSKIKSIPRSDARIPAASPSKSTVMFFVSRFISLICSEVKAVPEEDTTLCIPV